MNDRLFDSDELVEVPLVRPPRRRRGAAAGVTLDARFENDYPPEWDECPDCCGRGKLVKPPTLGAPIHVGPITDEFRRYAEDDVMPVALAEQGWTWMPCPRCLGMGSVKARVRREAGHRCLRCRHPYVPKGDAKMLGVEPSWKPGGWSPCDETCGHDGPIRYRFDDGEWNEDGLIAAHGWVDVPGYSPTRGRLDGAEVDAAWRILTVHHLDGDKANLRWWNLVALCQRCHLEIQSRVVMERVYPHEHSEWFKPYAAGYYAHVYLGEELTRDDTVARIDELLALERA